MNIKYLFVLALSLVMFNSCDQVKYQVTENEDTNGYHYHTVTNDPMGVRIYTLDNGLKVYLTKNPEKPRIQTFIAVRAGSTYDPKETTGLAHYLEHMMFKGTDEIGTINWDKEKELLKQVSDLYEAHKSTTDPETKKAIYAQIDSVSQEAAKLTVANEYDKMINSLGANGTNAWTSHEQTVYMNDIPSNELEKWLDIEQERFSQLVLRLFHTELETVYEEFNMSQDSDYRKVYFQLMKHLFPTHPYGTQNTIGEAEHLKNPSMVNIHDYWNTYYVPNNMAICLSGDLDFDKTIQLIDQAFGKFESKPVPEIELPQEEPLIQPVEVEVKGPDAENVTFSFRFDGTNSADKPYVELVDMILNNSIAGLIDLNLVQKQKVIRAGSYSTFYKHYGMHTFYGNPREGQSLEEVKDLILAEIEKIKNGEFEEWLVEAVINDLKLNQIKQRESNFRAVLMVNAFTNNTPWIEEVKYLDELEKITKEDIVNFAKEHYKDNYVVVYKRNGKDENIIKVEKPQITKVPLNRENSSEFFKAFENKPSPRLDPEFVDFEQDIIKKTISQDCELVYIPNEVNETFSLSMVVNIGNSHNPQIPLAIDLLPYLGTEEYSPEDLKKEFYKLGIQLYASRNDNTSRIYISGLEKNFEEGLKLMEHVLAQVKPSQEVYDEFVKNQIKKRDDNLKNKSLILWGGLMNYGKYGPHSPFTNHIANDKLAGQNPNNLTSLVKDLSAYPHRLVYIGQKPAEQVESIIKKHHQLPEQRKEVPEPINFTESETNKNKVLFVDYDMVQTQIIMLAKDQPFNPKYLPVSDLFGEYFGSGLSSIVFQEIRESKGLAYSAFASYQTPSKPEESHYIMGYLATQADKLKDATDELIFLMNNMPKSEIQFNASKESALKKIETDRKSRESLFWHYEWHRKMGLEKDRREEAYHTIQNLTLDQMATFFDHHIKNKKYTFLVIGNKNELDMDALSNLGPVQELTLEDLFNYRSDQMISMNK